MVGRLGTVQQKILLLLWGGLALGLSHSPKVSFKILEGIAKDWEEINRDSLRRGVKSLHNLKLIKEIRNDDGSITVVLSQKGKKKAQERDMAKIKINKPQKWDRRWRVVLFDIPEDRKSARDGLRYRLKKLGFCEYQKSVFVHPYDCKKEIDYIVEFYGVQEFVGFIIADSFNNEKHLKKYFGLV